MNNHELEAGAIVFGVMGGLLAVYLAWLVVGGPQRDPVSVVP